MCLDHDVCGPCVSGLLCSEHVCVALVFGRPMSFLFFGVLSILGVFIKTRQVNDNDRNSQGRRTFTIARLAKINTPSAVSGP